MTLSVIVIALNEAATIGRCLASVTWADERIVLDGGSRDDTAAIARSHGAIVEIAADWPGFGPQKNRALALAHGDWVLALDADEWVTPALRDALAAALRTPGAASAFRLPRQSSYCGRPMRHSRLVARSCGATVPARSGALLRRPRARTLASARRDRDLADAAAA